MSLPGRLQWVLKLAGGQFAVALPVAALFAVLSGVGAAGAVLVGALIAASGQALFGLRLFAPGVAPAARLARALYAAEILKWIWVLGWLWVAIVVARLAPLPLVVGLATALVGFLLASAWLSGSRE